MMRFLVTLSICGFLAAPLAAVEWQDDFTGGLNLPWTFFSDDGAIPPSHTDVIVIGDALELLGRDPDFPDENSFAGGLVGLGTNPELAFADAVQLTATISPTENFTVAGPPHRDNNDVFLLNRSLGASGYVLALDRNSGSFDLVRSDNGDPSNISPGLIVPNYDAESSYIMRLTSIGNQHRGEIFDTSMNLLLDAYAVDDTYTNGFAGVGTAINADIATDPDRTLLAARWDDVLATDENIAPPPPAFFPAQRLDTRTPTASALNVVEVRDIQSFDFIRYAIDAIANAAPAGRTEGTIATFDIHDPDNGANMGAVPSLQEPILTDEIGVDDDNFTQLVSGTFEIAPELAGDVTFNVHSDDGFAMRLFYDGPAAGEDLVLVPFTRIGDRGYLTPHGEAVYPETTGDTDVQALANLEEGTYSFEFVWFEGTGGAFAEVSAEFGDFIDNPDGVSWFLLGDEFGVPLVDGLGMGPVGLPPVGIPGDYNGNGTVEQADLDLVLLNWGETLADPGSLGWVNDLPSGAIDQAELDGVLLNWGNMAALGGANVPEPAALAIALVCCLIGAAGRRSPRS